MTHTQRLNSVLGTLRATRDRLESHDMSHYNIDEQIRQIEAGEDTEDPKTSLQYLADGLAILDRAQSYLYSRTYTSDGAGCRTWGTWFDNVSCAVTELHRAGDKIRQAIAYQIQARLY